MDPVTLGGMVVSLLAPFLTEAGKAAATKLGHGAADQLGGLLDTLKHKFEADNDAYAGQTLQRLEEKPDAEPRKRAFADALAEKAEDDPDFKAELERLVNSARQNQATQQFLTNVYGGEVGQILSIGSVQTLNIGQRGD
jgi:hypothetical protein